MFSEGCAVFIQSASGVLPPKVKKNPQEVNVTNNLFLNYTGLIGQVISHMIVFQHKH